jgi:hypothetical protein
MNIIVNKGLVYLTEIENKDLTVISDNEIISLDMGFDTSIIGKSFEIADFTAFANTEELIKK